jgi:hypothetical protein
MDRENEKWFPQPSYQPSLWLQNSFVNHEGNFTKKGKSLLI